MQTREERKEYLDKVLKNNHKLYLDLFGEIKKLMNDAGYDGDFYEYVLIGIEDHRYRLQEQEFRTMVKNHNEHPEEEELIQKAVAVLKKEFVFDFDEDEIYDVEFMRELQFVSYVDVHTHAISAKLDEQDRIVIVTDFTDDNDAEEYLSMVKDVDDRMKILRAIVNNAEMDS